MAFKWFTAETRKHHHEAGKKTKMLTFSFKTSSIHEKEISLADAAADTHAQY
jgi:hypothetical protein